MTKRSQLVILLGALLSTVSLALAQPDVPGRNTAAQPAVGKQGMISTAHPLATQAGLEILAAGGNAFDAAVAVAATLNVVEPMMSGMGGFGATLLYDAKRASYRCLDASGRFPAGNRCRRLSYPVARITCQPQGSQIDLHARQRQRTGKRWRRNTASCPGHGCSHPAIKLADEGFVISAHTAKHIQNEFPAFPEYAKDFYGKEGKPLQAGDRLTQKDLARSLRLLAEQGAKVIHGGELATAIDKTMRETGGFLRLDDLKRNQAEWWEPVSIDYRGHKVVATPLPNNAWNGLLRLGIMSRFDLAKMGHNSPAYLHTYAEATKLAYRARLQFAGDRDNNPPPLEQLLSEKHWALEAAKIKPQKAAAAGSLLRPRARTQAGGAIHDPFRHRRSARQRRHVDADARHAVRQQGDGAGHRHLAQQLDAILHLRAEGQSAGRTAGPSQAGRVLSDDRGARRQTVDRHRFAGRPHHRADGPANGHEHDRFPHGRAAGDRRAAPEFRRAGHHRGRRRRAGGSAQGTHGPGPQRAE